MVTTNEKRLYEVEAPQAIKVVDTVQENINFPKATSHTSYRLYDEIYLCENQVYLETQRFSKYTNMKLQSLEGIFMNNLNDEHKLLFYMLKQKLNETTNNTDNLEMSSEEIMCLIEDVICLISGLYRHITAKDTSKFAIMETIIIFFKLRCKRSAVYMVADLFAKNTALGKIIDELVTSMLEVTMTKFNNNRDTLPDMHLQSINDVGERVDTAYDIFTKITDFKDTTFYKKLHKFCLYLISFGVCEKFGYTMSDLGYSVMEANYLKKNKTFGPNFLVTLVDTILYVLKKGIQVIKTGDINCIYHSGDTYGLLYDNYNLLKTQTQQLHNPELFGFNVSSYQNMLDDTIEQFANVKKHTSNLSKFDKEAVNKCFNDLQFWRTDLITKKSSRALRPAPYSVLFFGESGVGKTYLKEFLYSFYGKLMKLETTPEFCFTRSPGSNFWDGFRSSMWCVVLDDIAFTHPNKCPNGDPTFQDLIQICNNQPFCPDQAALEDKGRTPMMARLLIATTNVKNMNAAQYFSHASAAQRRLPIIITPTVRPEYAKEDGMLDKSKLPEPIPGRYDDFWTFDVDVVKARLTTDINKYAENVKILKSATLPELLNYLKDSILEHERSQKSFMSAVRDVQAISLCDKCSMPIGQFCKCDLNELHVQGTIESLNIYLHIFQFCIIMYFLFKQKISSVVDDIAVLKRIAYYPRKIYSWYDDWKMLVESHNIPHHHTSEAVSTVDHRRAFNNMLEHPDNQIEDLTEEQLRAKILEQVRVMRLNKVENKTDDESSKYIYNPDDVDINDMIPQGEHARRFYAPSLREYWIDLGKHQYEQILGASVAKKCAYAIGVACTALTVYKIYHSLTTKKSDMNIHGNVDIASIGTKPIPHPEERQNPWVNDNIHLSKFELTPQITSAKSTDMLEFVKRIAADCISIKITHSKGYIGGKAVCLRGNTYITNNHNVPTLDLMSSLEITQHHVNKGINGNIVCSLSNRDVIRYPDKDICVIFITGIPPKRGIFNYLPKRGMNTLSNGYYVNKDWEGKMRTFKVEKIYLSKNVPIKKTGTFNIDVTVDIWNGFCTTSMKDGYCGSPLIVDTPMGKCVAGLHFLGDNDGRKIAANAIYREDFLEVMDNYHRFTIQANVPNMTCDDIERKLIDLNPRSNVRYLEKGSIDVYGSVEGFRPKYKSTVNVSPLAHYLSDKDYKIKYGKPDLNGWEPWNHALQDITQPLQMFNTEVLVECTDSFISDILSEVNKSELSEVCIVDMFTAINGACGVAYVDKIPRNTSAGFPWNTSKKHYMHDIPAQHDLADPVDVTDSIKLRCAKIIENYHNDTRSSSIFTAHVKDEPLNFAKLKAKKSRIFSGSPMDLTIVTRMYLVTTIRLIQNNKRIFESAPGIIAQSDEWKCLYEYLTSFGDGCMIAGDYRKFDKTMSAKFILEAFRILRTIVNASGNYSTDDLKVIDGIAIDTAYAWTNFNGDLVQFFGSNPSGHALTVIINGLVNCLYMRYAYICLNPKAECNSFKQNVKLITYGDDNVAGVNPSCSWYNHTSISNLFAAYGLEYTMADKTAESIPYIHIDNVSFLKRSFRFDKDTGFCMAPLELESIEKQLMVWTYSKSIEPAAQAAAVVNSAVREYFFYGKEIFTEKRNLLRKCLQDLELDQWVTQQTFPTWDELVEVYALASERPNF